MIAQIDLSGYWNSPMQEDALERGGGPMSGEYQGIPLNDAARMRADSWSSSLLTVPERQCIPHPADYGPSFSNLQMWKDMDPVTRDEIAWHTHMSWMAVERTIWMDGRPHPPDYAPHTWQGFSTGKWEKNTLTVTTTHLKTGWIRRNGIPRGDRATITEHFIRNGDVLTWVTIIYDPEYLTEPMVRSRDFTLNPYGKMDAYPCESVEEIVRPQGVVPHYLPGKNPFLTEFATKYHLPQEAARGGAETMYPEYQDKLKALTAAGAANK
ncbi:MAG TPA: hypothetical protein VIY49_38215 [Bryobacteraceae bacterium]